MMVAAKGTPSEAPPRTREASKQETREALIAAGIEAFAAEGLDAPSLDSICARAGFTRGAFYVHFKDRDDFLVAVMESIFTTFLDAIIATGDAALDLRLTIDAFITATTQKIFPLRGGVPFHQFLAACARTPRIREQFVAVLQEAVRRVTIAVREGQTANTVRGDVNPEHVASLLTAIALGLQAVVEIQYPVDVHAAKGDLLKLLGKPGESEI